MQKKDTSSHRNYSEDEWYALLYKLEHPDALVKCPKCGNDIIYEKRGISIAVECLLENCILAVSGDFKLEKIGVMGKELDLDLDPTRWISAFSDYEDNKVVLCPICSSRDIEVIAACGSDLYGFIAFTCLICTYPI